MVMQQKSRSMESQPLIVSYSGALEVLGPRARRDLQRGLRFTHQHDSYLKFVSREAFQDVCSWLSKTLRPSHFGIEVDSDRVLHDYGCRVQVTTDVRGFARELVVMMSITTTDLEVRELLGLRRNEAASQLVAKGVGGKYNDRYAIYSPALLMSYCDEKDAARGRFRQSYGPISTTTQELLLRTFPHLQFAIVPASPPRQPAERVTRRPQAHTLLPAWAAPAQLTVTQLPPLLESSTDFPTLSTTTGQAGNRKASATRAAQAARRQRPASASTTRSTIAPSESGSTGVIDAWDMEEDQDLNELIPPPRELRQHR